MEQLLPFADAWTDLRTRAIQFQELPFDTSQPLALENLRSLSAARFSACQRQDAAKTTADQHAEWLEQYLPRLDTLADRMDGAVSPDLAKHLAFSWTSPLAGRPDQFNNTEGLVVEQAMAYQLYAASLRQRGFDVFAGMTPPQPAVSDTYYEDSYSGVPPPEPASAAAAYTMAAGLLRQAAGVYQYAMQTFLRPAEEAGGLTAARPPELVSAVLTALSNVALAEAQTVAAARADAKGSSTALVASLHVGVAEFYDKAADLLREHASELPALSERLRRFLALGSGLALMRARRAWATHEASNGAAGIAVACLQGAARLEQQLQPLAASDNRWRAVLEAETLAREVVMGHCERDRTKVYFQPVATAPSALPDGKSIVSPLPFERLA